ncbi:MAG TPA: tetratricopeptide repeat protein [Candidatus Acidoferrales bacterium]|nr:tetratricopeptide repeat protein [Candidatus Acidoferrales bacterium]
MSNHSVFAANPFRCIQIPSSRQITLCALAIALGATPLLAQRGRAGGGGGGARGSGAGVPSGFPGSTPSYGGQPYPTLQPVEPNTMPSIIPEAPSLSAQMVEDEACLPWAVPIVRGATVDVIRLEVPSKARSEYNKACGQLKKRNFAEAETHVRDAIQKYPEYVAAWVMLGQVLQGLQLNDQATEACSHAGKTDPTYLPAYLCLADLDANEGHWNELLNVTKTALGLNPVSDVYAYFYRATALFKLDKLGEAEKEALLAAGMDRDHRQVAVHYLLAQIYGAKGDIASATAELHQFLKVNNDRQKSDEARQYLAKLVAQEKATN